MKFERDYFVHYYDSDLNKRLLPTSLMKYFEDIAVLQSEEASVGLDYYARNNVGWVLYKWDITIHDYPRFRDIVRVITEPLAFARFYAFRSFEAASQDGKILASGSSMWFFVDTKLRKPTKIPQEVYDGYNIGTGDIKSLEFGEAVPPSETSLHNTFSVRQSDIDTNGHVNNIKYVEWALEVIPPEILTNYTLERIKVVYKKETMYGHTINSCAGYYEKQDRIIFNHKISDGEVDVCILETTWKKL